MSKGDKYKNLSLKEYLNMIRPHLRDLVNEHKPTVELNNNNNNNDNNNNNNNNNNNRAEWKIQLRMHINCISTKKFKNKHTMHSRSKPVEIFVGSKTKDVTFLNFKNHKKHEMKEEANFFLIVLNYYIEIFKE